MKFRTVLASKKERKKKDKRGVTGWVGRPVTVLVLDTFRYCADFIWYNNSFQFYLIEGNYLTFFITASSYDLY